MTRKRFIKLCMGRLRLSRNEAAAIAESKGITYHYARIAFSLQDCAAAFVAHYALVSDLTNVVIRCRHVKRVQNGVIEYDEQ